MKKLILAILMAQSVWAGFAQVQIKSLPKQGYEKRIREYVVNMKVVDTHEHLRPPKDLMKDISIDFPWLLNNYAAPDIWSAGMEQKDFAQLFNKSLSVLQKWQLLKPYWEGASNTAFNRSVLLTANGLFGVKNIDSTTVEELSEKIRKAYQNPNTWFYKVLKEKCKIEFAVEDNVWGDRNDFYDPNIFRFIKRFDNFIFISSEKDIENLAKWNTSGIHSLNDLVSALNKSFHSAKDEGIVGIKSGLAYNRILSYENVTKERAEEVFDRIKNTTGEIHLSFDEVKPLQDYMMHRMLDLANANHLPFQIHTGLNWGSNIEFSNPTHLVNLFQEYPDVKFILFHGAYPYGGELATLAKNFRNVYIDMCWLYIISPSYSERYLHEWLETVPANKIMGFGGDFTNVEGTYGHLLIARQVVSNVLTAKVRDGYFTESEAIKIAQMILHDNAIRILNLK